MSLLNQILTFYGMFSRFLSLSAIQVPFHFIFHRRGNRSMHLFKVTISEREPGFELRQSNTRGCWHKAPMHALE